MPSPDRRRADWKWSSATYTSQLLAGCLVDFFESLSPTPAQAIYVVGQAAGRQSQPGEPNVRFINDGRLFFLHGIAGTRN
ncbi:uncharacterized protein G6M90_00g086120 [Metarhizium brunneum]|uniref:Uncharacterized protein n=1 Tax=Metarhizium brunneum TaxID=500148 RepID=A0A7D5V293_9HYPO|nr:hypothetical protein G6M90_00g086120 [Metarhizium brunneum]